MGKILAIFACIALAVASRGQSSGLITRMDTIQVSQGDKGWIIQEEPNAKPETMPAYLLRLVSTRVLKAYDPMTGEPIPSFSIYSWRMGTDSVWIWNEKEQRSELKVVEQKVDPATISMVKVMVNWKMDPQTGNLRLEVETIELVRNVYSSMGTLIGRTPHCIIRYDP